MADGSGPHVPAPDPAPQPQQPVIVTNGAISLILGFAKLVSNLTTERALILFICTGAGWNFYSREKSQAEDKAQERRMGEERAERDRRHCDDREDRLRRDAAVEAEKLRAWYALQADSQRRFESEQREKDRAAVAELTKVIQKKFPELP